MSDNCHNVIYYSGEVKELKRSVTSLDGMVSIVGLGSDTKRLKYASDQLVA